MSSYLSDVGGNDDGQNNQHPQKHVLIESLILHVLLRHASIREGSSALVLQCMLQQILMRPSASMRWLDLPCLALYHAH